MATADGFREPIISYMLENHPLVSSVLVDFFS